MDKIKFGARKTPANDSDKEFIKKDETYLLVGKGDKSISIMDKGEQTVLTPETKFDTNNGIGEINIQNALIKFGTTLVTADTVETFTFDTPFPNNCLVIIGSQKLNDYVNNVMLEAVDKTSYKISVSGGSGGEYISWIAVGN